MVSCLCFFKSVRLGAKIDWAAPVPLHPRRHVVFRWRADKFPAQARPQNRKRTRPDINEADVVLELPKRAKTGPEPVAKGGLRAKEIDPIRLLRALFVTDFMRNQAQFSTLMGHAHAYDHPEAEAEDRDATSDPKGMSIYRAISKLDIVDCLLYRREFRAWMQLDSILAINAWSDSSPVSGDEMQGMILDVNFRNGDKVRTCLPGASLAYGNFDAANKSAGLMHAIWMIAGPDYATCRYVCDKIVSITTDMGVEIGTLCMPDFVLAYCKYMSGTPFHMVSEYVNRDRRWLPNALRVSGWSHAFGNIMKAIAYQVAEWPTWLDKWRGLVTFWRNETYVKHVRTMLHRSGDTSVDVRTVRRLNVSFAKWRYETIAAVSRELSSVRPVCQDAVRQEWFNNMQDREFLKKFVDACADDTLWRFTTTSSAEVWSRLERARHWGMVCDCAEHRRLRHQGTFVYCVHSSRRLHQAPDFIATLALELQTRAANITKAECGGNDRVFDVMKQLLTAAAAMLRERFRYLHHVPWSFSNCDSVDGCIKVIRQVESRPLADHDPLTQNIWKANEAHIRTRAAGGPLHPDLNEEVQRIRTTPLDESCGEEFHAKTNKEARRAEHCSKSHLKQACRRKGVLAHIRRFRRRWGARADCIIRWEWRHYKRILQGKSGKRWLGKKCTALDVRNGVYHEGPGAECNWGSVFAKETERRHTVTEDASNSESVQNEFLRNLMTPGGRYRVTAQQQQAQGAEEPHEVPVHSHFQFVRVTFPKHRPVLMPTVQSADDLSLTASLAFLIQRFSEWSRPANMQALAEGQVDVIPEGEPEWVRPSSMAPFEQFINSLIRWHGLDDGPAQGVVVLGDARSVRVHTPIMDPACPVMTIVQYLKSKGWVAVQKQCTHDQPVIGIFDGYEAIKFKPYFQVLATLPRCLPLTSTVPSRHVVAFYHALLRGLRVEPGETSKHYQLVINADKKKRGRTIDLMPIENVPPGTDPDGIIVCGPEQPTPPRSEEKTCSGTVAARTVGAAA